MATGATGPGRAKLAGRVGSGSQRYVVDGVAEGISAKGEPVAVGNRSAGSLALALRAADEKSDACGARRATGLVGPTINAAF